MIGRGLVAVELLEYASSRVLWMYINILDKTLKPFIHHVYSDGHRFMADNDPKHNSIAARDWLEGNDISGGAPQLNYPTRTP